MTEHSELKLRLILAAMAIILLTLSFSDLGESNNYRWTRASPIVLVAATVGQTGNLTVVVFGLSGPINGATVTIMSGPSGSTIPRPALTDVSGNVTFTGLIPGSYVYRVEAVGYSSVQDTATVIAGQSNTTHANLHFQSGEGAQYVAFYILGFGSVLALILFLVRKRIWRKKKGGTWGEEDFFQG
jgi:carboxypeptidase family protein